MLRVISTKRKKKKKVNKNEIQPQKHKRTNNLNFYSEEIVKEIIDKIISLSITRIITSKIDKDISYFCYSGIKRVINDLIQISYINRDKDDIYYTFNILNNNKYSNSDEKKFKYKRHINTNKKKKEIAEKYLLSSIKKKHLKIELDLKENKYSDYLSKSFEQPKNIIIKSPKKINNDIEINNENFWGLINQPKSLAFHRHIPLSNNVFPLSQTANQINEVEETQSKKKSKLFYYYKPSKTIKNKDMNSIKEEIPFKKRLFSIIQLDSLKKLDDEKFKKKKIESDEIIELRKKKLEEIEKKKEEEKLRNQKIISNITLDKAFSQNNIKLNFINNQKINEQNKYIEKQIKKGNFTTDINGNIVIINEINPDKLSKELPTLYTKQKDVKVFFNNDYPSEKKKKDNQVIIRNNSNIDLKNKKINILANKFKSSIIPEYLAHKSESTIFAMKLKSMKIPEYFKPKIQPSGSNFDLIKPEIGVIVHEEAKTKSGGNNFYSKYNKYSTNDFNRTLKETLDSDRLNYKEKEIENSNKNEISKKIVSYKEKIKNMDNKSKNQNETNLFEKIFSKSLEKDDNSKKNYNKYLNKSQSEILLSNNKYSLMEDLFAYEDNEKNIKAYGENNINKKIKKDQLFNIINKNNLFKKKIKAIRNENNFKDTTSYRVMDSFNKSIVLGIKNDTELEEYIMPKIQIKNLPIIPIKRNQFNVLARNNTNSTLSNFFRARRKDLSKNY